MVNSRKSCRARKFAHEQRPSPLSPCHQRTISPEASSSNTPNARLLKRVAAMPAVRAPIVRCCWCQPMIRHGTHQHGAGTLETEQRGTSSCRRLAAWGSCQGAVAGMTAVAVVLTTRMWPCQRCCCALHHHALWWGALDVLQLQGASVALSNLHTVADTAGARLPDMLLKRNHSMTNSSRVNCNCASISK